MASQLDAFEKMACCSCLLAWSTVGPGGGGEDDRGISMLVKCGLDTFALLLTTASAWVSESLLSPLVTPPVRSEGASTPAVPLVLAVTVREGEGSSGERELAGAAAVATHILFWARWCSRLASCHSAFCNTLSRSLVLFIIILRL